MNRGRSPDFSRSVLEDVYRYRQKRQEVAWGLWLVTGLFGGHRFYMGRTISGLLMLATGGGGGIWWFVDAFFVNRMVQDYNERQAEREKVGLPPIEMDFMPAIPTDEEMAGEPAWAGKRGGRARLAGDALVLLIAGMALGAVTASRGDFEALAAVLVLIAITVLGPDGIRRFPSWASSTVGATGCGSTTGSTIPADRCRSCFAPSWGR